MGDQKDSIDQLADRLTVLMGEPEFRRPIEGTFGESLKQMKINRATVRRLLGAAPQAGEKE